MSRLPLFTALMLIGLYHAAHAASLSLTSPSTQTGLLELYTSEGCSSCPPADRWLSSLTDDERLWNELVPVAFHVDYWNYIGWKDRFSSPAFSQRQKHYARQRSVRAVYTPGFVYNGTEWRRSLIQRFPSTPRSRTIGVLDVELNDQLAQVRFEPATELAGDLKVKIALLGFGLSTEIKAGENHGHTLDHDFVVLALQEAPLQLEDGAHVAAVAFPASDVIAPRYGVAAWISRVKEQTPIQAVGGWLPDMKQ